MVKIIDSNTEVLALIGDPIKHSFSPRIQNYFMEKYGRNAIYLAFEFGKKDLEKAFTGAKKLKFTGLNVTMPHKEEIFRLMDELDINASAVRSVNTVKFDKKNSKASGFNTDLEGFLRSLEEKDFSFKDKTCLVIGAGGSARSCIYGLLKKNVKKIYVFNRTYEKVLLMKRFFTDAGSRIIAVGKFKDLDDLEPEIELVVNCTPQGMDIDGLVELMPVPEKWDLGRKYIFEMVYKPVETELVKKAIREGAVVINGIDMLVNQAAFSFKLWFDIMPETEKIKEIISEDINNKQNSNFKAIK